ncbi:uncharacterized protein KY384_003007 [Bacidia gigantensis]|uniref:uncharacterized protein n=1 Tax=Bacidia gigantensis TaxID=2732470 RepID=UPI001D049799|nr:uncharacterized protein KY384_003007 [Bacidia gigantensis]KAG8531378.1 hypothetical protein KY384_003007 [Bacidia gigantensis]
MPLTKSEVGPGSLESLSELGLGHRRPNTPSVSHMVPRRGTGRTGPQPASRQMPNGNAQDSNAEESLRRSDRLAQQQQSQGSHAPVDGVSRGEAPQSNARQSGNSHIQASPIGRQGHATSGGTSSTARPAGNLPFQFAATFDHQPPRQIRPRQLLPPIIVRLQVVGGVGPNGMASPFDAQGSMHAVCKSSTVQPGAADGDQIAASAPEHHTILRSKSEWTFDLRPIEFHTTGYCQLEIYFIYVPRGTTPANDTVRIATITSRPIHVHSFAPLFPG